jgi:rhamnosyltransferase
MTRRPERLVPSPAMTAQTPAASIIIPAKNEARNIGACLDAIFAQQLEGTVEVILIDSGSTDGTVDIVRRYPVRLHEIRPEEFGHGRTRNLGARMAQAEALVFLNADATPQGTDWLQGLLRELEPPDVAGVYGRQIARPDAYPMERFFLDYWYGPKRREQRMAGGQLDVNNVFFSTVNCAMKRAAWERFPFDETVVMTEDQVWSRQALEAGYALVYAPELAVVHSHNYTLGQAFRRFFDAGWSAEASFAPGAGSSLTLLRRTVAYPLREMAHLARTRQWAWMPRAAVYESVKLAGVVAGRSHRLLPMSLKRRWSANYRA